MKSRFSGMTVNERLYVAGLSNDFENCVKNKDFDGIKTILNKIELGAESIIDRINTLGFSN